MKPILIVLSFFLLISCKEKNAAPKPAAENKTQTVWSPAQSFVRINASLQKWNPQQPWDKSEVDSRGALGVVIKPNQVLTTANLVTYATNIELESIDGAQLIPAKVIAVDYESNLALIGADDESKADAFFKDKISLPIAEQVLINDLVRTYQYESNGNPIISEGSIQAIEMSTNLLTDNPILYYRLKSSLQGSRSSYSLPVLNNQQLAGLLVSYDNDEQLSNIIATEVIARFLKNEANHTPHGFPQLGVRASNTDDPVFREYLKLNESQGGVYIHEVFKQSPAEQADIKIGDVILEIDHHTISPLGYYNHPKHGELYWSHLVQQKKVIDDQLQLTIWRDGHIKNLTVDLNSKEKRPPLIHSKNYDKAPQYLVKGGIIFQELSMDILESLGENWENNAPVNLLDAFHNPQSYQDRYKHLVVITGILPTPATIGYDTLRYFIIQKVNNQPISNIQDLDKAFSNPSGDFHVLEFENESIQLPLSEKICKKSDLQLMQLGISSLKRID